LSNPPPPSSVTYYLNDPLAHRLSTFFIYSGELNQLNCFVNQDTLCKKTAKRNLLSCNFLLTIKRIISTELNEKNKIIEFNNLDSATID
jgi:hypothetical protein